MNLTKGCEKCHFHVNMDMCNRRYDGFVTDASECWNFRDYRDKTNFGTRSKESIVARLDGQWDSPSKKSRNETSLRGGK